MADKVVVTGLREFREACSELAVSVGDMREVFSAVAALGARTAAAYSPKRTGVLASDIRGSHATKTATVRAGRKTVPYAGVVNYGWPAHGIAASHFMQRVDQVWQPYAIARLARRLDKKIRQEGLE